MGMTAGLWCSRIKPPSVLSRLRYWLHPFQAPKYGRGFIASEEQWCPSVRPMYAVAKAMPVSHFIRPDGAPYPLQLVPDLLEVRKRLPRWDVEIPMGTEGTTAQLAFKKRFPVGEGGLL